MTSYEYLKGPYLLSEDKKYGVIVFSACLFSFSTIESIYSDHTEIECIWNEVTKHLKESFLSFLIVIDGLAIRLMPDKY
ncbi:hypothetical protein BDB01DRAFT_796404 [Pilobolus umbonatus]|nr:hypothetical protein BDB01DRAFT_796404 [Pilobolus umbonatus]